MNYFVFVVCGSREHTDTLNFSLNYLKHFSQSKIVVITDTSRNESEINHDHIIDVKTPEQYSHHEASIFLKTSLHQYLEMKPENEFCYLDSDVVAVSNAVDEIFEQKPAPILFAKDHDHFDSFSPYALNCGCLEKLNASIEALSEKLDKLSPNFKHQDPYRQEAERELMQAFDRMKKQPVKHSFQILKYVFNRFISPKQSFLFAKKFRFNKTNLAWYNQDGKIISFDYPRLSEKLEKTQGITYDKTTQNWQSQGGKHFFTKTISCPHLREYIQDKYVIKIPPKWRHWNGGVFRFNQKSIDFLDTWHKLTIEEFKNPYTKTRDQAMLAVTVWKYGIENMKTLSVKYNFITEYNNPAVAWHSEKGYTYNRFKSKFSPAFLHIYHHWGHDGWSIWDSLKKQIVDGATNEK
jgi:hypothetical protein